VVGVSASDAGSVDSVDADHICSTEELGLIHPSFGPEGQ